ncbi:MAG: hypothetical protein ACR2FY_11640 [Pirellulaceae bacterium]
MSRLNSSRREFLSQVGRGMFVASVGSALAIDLGLTPAFAAEEPASRISFGAMDALVDLLQATPVNKLLPLVVEKLKAGTTLKEFTAAAALANARAFGGEDYIGFHTLMALGPALAMSAQMNEKNAALPVLKVLYRNTEEIQKTGKSNSDTIKPIQLVASSLPSGASAADAIRDAVHRGDRAAAEQLLATSVAQSPADGFNNLLPTVDESTDVHRVVLMHRAWDMLSIVGQENALSMLRQSLGYCLKNEKFATQYAGEVRKVLPAVMDQFKLDSRECGTKTVDDKWVMDMMNTLFTATPQQGAEAVAAAIVEGINPLRITEAISLTANQLVLRDAGRTAKQVQPGKPEGSVHGDSIGVHASDSAHAWRNIALAANTRNKNAALVLAGYQVALDRTERGGDFQTWKNRPWTEHLEQVKSTEKCELLGQLTEAIKANDQAQACAVVAKYGQEGHSEGNIFHILREYAVSQDGALHAEKYYKTTSDDFALTSKDLRWRHLIALARVTASEFGREAAGHHEACELLGST